jgi:hypothetical protein
MRAVSRSITLVPAFLAVVSAGVVADSANLTPPGDPAETGFGSLTISDVATVTQADFHFNELSNTTLQSHCLADDAGSSICAAFPFNATSPTQDFSYYACCDSADVAGSAEAALLTGLASAAADLDIREANVPGSTLRGIIVSHVPEPASLFRAGAALIWIGLLRSRKTRHLRGQ